MYSPVHSHASSDDPLDATIRRARVPLELSPEELSAEVRRLEEEIRHVAESYRDSDATLMVGAGHMWNAMHLAKTADSVSYVTFLLTGVPGMRAEDLLSRLQARIDDREIECKESSSRYDTSPSLFVTVHHARTRSAWNPMLYRYRYYRRLVAAVLFGALFYVVYHAVYL